MGVRIELDENVESGKFRQHATEVLQAPCRVGSVHNGCDVLVVGVADTHWGQHRRLTQNALHTGLFGAFEFYVA